MIKTIMSRLPNLEAMREKGIVKGESTGFNCLDELYSVKQGTFTIFYAEPTHGKSEFIFEMCFNQAQQYEKRTLVCSPETGSLDEIIAELVHKYTGKQIYKNIDFEMTEREFNIALEWISHHFLVVDTDEKTYSIPALFELADAWEKENPDQKIDIIVGEPYNELDHSEMGVKYGARQDLYIEDLMSIVRRLCRTKKRHFMLSVHPSGSAIPITKDKITYYPKPLPRQAAGGQALFRKAMTWITLWRPPKELNDDTGFSYRPNEVHVFIDKAKPKGVSFKGMARLYFDWKKNRYYEVLDGQNLYAFEHKKQRVNEPDILSRFGGTGAVIIKPISISDVEEEPPF